MMHMADRLFIAVWSTGLGYYDRGRVVSNDYMKLAFLPFDTLELEIKDGHMPAELLEKIKADAVYMRAKAGEEFSISGCGQTVMLGTKVRA